MSKRLEFIARWCLKFIINIFLNILALTAYLVPKQKNLWVFLPHVEYGFADNAKYFYLKYYNQDSQNFTWLTRSKSVNDTLNTHGYKSVYKSSLIYYYLLLRAEYIIFDSYIRGVEHFLTKNSKRINLWHGVGIKKTDFDIDVGHRSKYYRNKVMRYVYGFFAPHLYQQRFTNVFVVPSLKYKSISIGAFGLDQRQILHGTYPRLSALLEPNAIYLLGSDTAQFENIKADSRVKYLYAPTFRDEQDNDNSCYKIGKILSKLCEYADINGGLILYKPHFTESLNDLPSYENLIIINKNEDVYPYMYYADILITDYSSIASDYMITKKPIIYFVYDKDFYLENCRGFYYEIETLASGNIALNYEDLKSVMEKGKNLSTPKSEIVDIFHDNVQMLNGNILFQAVVKAADD